MYVLTIDISMSAFASSNFCSNDYKIEGEDLSAVYKGASYCLLDKKYYPFEDCPAEIWHTEATSLRDLETKLRALFTYYQQYMLREGEVHDVNYTLTNEDKGEQCIGRVYYKE